MMKFLDYNQASHKFFYLKINLTNSISLSWVDIDTIKEPNTIDTDIFWFVFLLAYH